MYTCRQRKRGDYTAVAVEVSDLIQRHRVKYNLLFPSTYTHIHVYVYDGRDVVGEGCCGRFRDNREKNNATKGQRLSISATPPLASPCGLQTHTHTPQLFVYMYRYI